MTINDSRFYKSKSFSNLIFNRQSTLNELPFQMESINGLISSFRFMLEDEIAFALTQATPISQHILAKVTLTFNLV